METILAIAFGRQVEVLKGENDVIVDSVKNSLSSVNESGFMPLATLMPLVGTCLSPEIIYFIEFAVDVHTSPVPTVTFPWLESPLRSLLYHTNMAKSSRLLYSLSKQLVQERRETTNPQKVGPPDKTLMPPPPPCCCEGSLVKTVLSWLDLLS